MGQTSAQRYNKRMNEIWDYAKKVGAIDDKVTCTNCMRVISQKDADMMGQCNRCSSLRKRINLNWKEDVGF